MIFRVVFPGSLINVTEAGPLLFILLMLVVFWFLLLRPQRKQQQQMRQLQSELQVGQEVVLSSGIFGTIRGLSDSRAEIEVAPGTVLTVARQVVVRRVEELPDAAAPQAERTSAAAGDEADPTAAPQAPADLDEGPHEGRGSSQGQG